MQKIVAAYIPVLHEGYRRFLAKHADAEVVYVWGADIIAAFDYLAKEIRQLAPELVQRSLLSWGNIKRVEILTTKNLSDLQAQTIVLPDEDVSRAFAGEHLQGKNVVFDPIFLRWDKHNTLKEKPVLSDEQITRDEFHRRVMGEALKDAKKSSDFWRHVGAVVVKEGEVVLAGHNSHVPSPHMPYVHGDPRNNFHKGDHIEMSTAVHAEAGVIAEAARRGISLEGVDMYVTVFPCPPCAKLIAYSGVKTLYCGGGYGVLDGESILKSRGVRIIFVE